jgi:hypothetical protein
MRGRPNKIRRKPNAARDGKVRKTFIKFKGVTIGRVLENSFGVRKRIFTKGTICPRIENAGEIVRTKEMVKERDEREGSWTNWARFGGLGWAAKGDFEFAER